MNKLENLSLECCNCGHTAIIGSELAESHLGEPISMAVVGRLFGKLVCKACSSREVRISDAAGRVIVDPQSLTLCKVCGFPIALPRIAALPSTNICAACAAEGAKPPTVPHFPQPPAGLERCPRCSRPTVVRQNKEDQGYFLGCTSYPRCRWTTAFSK